MKKILLFVCTLIFCACEGWLEKEEKEVLIYQEEEIRKIYEFQNQRNSEALWAYLSHEKALYRKVAAQAFGSVQDSSSLDTLMVLLNDEHELVRKAAAFAIGQIANHKAEGGLVYAVQKEEFASVKATIFEAIGKCSSTSGLHFLVSVNEENGVLNLGISKGLYFAGVRGVKDSLSINKQATFLHPNMPLEVRRMSAQYFSRFRNSSNYASHQNLLLKVLKEDTDEIVKTNIALALSKLSNEVVLNALVTASENNSIYLKINILRALKNFPEEISSKTALKYLTHENPQVSITAAEYFVQNIQVKDTTVLFPVLESKLNERTKAILLGALFKIEASLSKDILSLIAKNYLESSNAYHKSALLQASSQNIHGFQWISQQFEEAKEVVVKTTAFESILALRLHSQWNELTSKNPQAKAQFIKNVKTAIQSADIALVSLSGEAIADEKYELRKEFTKTELQNAQNQLILPSGIEAHIALQKAIDALDSKKSENVSNPQYFKPIDWEGITKLSARQLATISTTKGDILIELLVNEAPISSSLFAELATQGFFKDRFFHRVVPNFVAQGGCPRGDGYGGLPQVIRSEFAPVYFERGHIGLASAGKDTESCQFFICHVPTPHLDGRYTNFAKVLEGMEVVDKLEIGDKILEIRLEGM
jgi:cyclophilin family peptidyl-prolyl cis-trans isomerase/HEAT repeat protein